MPATPATPEAARKQTWAASVQARHRESVTANAAPAVLDAMGCLAAFVRVAKWRAQCLVAPNPNSRVTAEPRCCRCKLLA